MVRDNPIIRKWKNKPLPEQIAKIIEALGVELEDD